jgi:hypothetical protein
MPYSDGINSRIHHYGAARLNLLMRYRPCSVIAMQSRNIIFSTINVSTSHGKSGCVWTQFNATESSFAHEIVAILASKCLH